MVLEVARETRETPDPLDQQEAPVPRALAESKASVAEMGPQDCRATVEITGQQVPLGPQEPSANPALQDTLAARDPRVTLVPMVKQETWALPDLRVMMVCPEPPDPMAPLASEEMTGFLDLKVIGESQEPRAGKGSLALRASLVTREIWVPLESRETLDEMAPRVGLESWAPAVTRAQLDQEEAQEWLVPQEREDLTDYLELWALKDLPARTECQA